ncbi:hypothetical protein AtNW77_Chr4g0292201 [Arabidopsis thaliana]
MLKMKFCTTVKFKNMQSMKKKDKPKRKEKKEKKTDAINSVRFGDLGLFSGDLTDKSYVYAMCLPTYNHFYW